MNDVEKEDRRNFIKLSAGMITSIPILLINTAKAQDLTQLTETDPNAVALGYKADASTVDLSVYPNFDSTQSCNNCLFYEARDGDDIGPCKMFLEQSVSGAGWCSLYTPEQI